MPGTRKLGRTTDHRTAMLRAMVTYLLENGKIETTVTRAKEVRSMTEKYITLAKTNNLHSKRQALAFITKEDVVAKLFNEIAPKYAEVNGGPTTDISPFKTLKNCGISSIPVLLKNLPNFVILGSSFILKAGPSISFASSRESNFLSASGFIERNL